MFDYAEAFILSEDIQVKEYREAMLQRIAYIPPKKDIKQRDANNRVIDKWSWTFEEDLFGSNYVPHLAEMLEAVDKKVSELSKVEMK